MSGFQVLQPASSRVAVTTRVILDGNFFKRDPGKTLFGNVQDMLDALAVDMETEVRRQIESHAGSMPYYTGWSARHTRGFREWNEKWGAWAAVQAYTKDLDKKDAIRTKAAMVTIEKRWHPYRSVKAGIYRSRALITANLTKGLE